MSSHAPRPTCFLIYSMITAWCDMIVVTTSRSPSQRTRSFVKELVAVIPGAHRFTRGKYTISELGYVASRIGAGYVWVVYEKRGNPSAIKVYSVDVLSPSMLLEHRLVLLHGVSLSRERGVPLIRIGCLSVDTSMCISDTCLSAGDVFIEAAGPSSSSCPGRVALHDKDKYTEARFMHGETETGPVIRIRGVRVLGDKD